MRDDLLKLTKLDAAQRQLRTAIQLWFAESDPVSIHALGFAAYEIIHALFRRKGLNGLLWDSAIIKDEYRADFARHMKSHATFFKHAQRDADAEIEFHPRSGEVFLIAATCGLQQMGESLGLEESAFMMWLRIHNPSWFGNDVLEKHLPVETLRKVKSVQKDEFLEGYRQHWAGR